MAERLRRQTRNLLGSPRAGSNPAECETTISFCFCCISWWPGPGLLMKFDSFLHSPLFVLLLFLCSPRGPGPLDRVRVFGFLHYIMCSSTYITPNHFACRTGVLAQCVLMALTRRSQLRDGFSVSSSDLNYIGRIRAWNKARPPLLRDTRNSAAQPPQIKADDYKAYMNKYQHAFAMCRHSGKPACPPGIFQVTVPFGLWSLESVLSPLSR